jgi:hypothetical protein
MSANSTEESNTGMDNYMFTFPNGSHTQYRGKLSITSDENTGMDNYVFTFPNGSHTQYRGKLSITSDENPSRVCQ